MVQKDFLTGFTEEELHEIYHYGMPRRSGRYPWGSGKEPFQHNGPQILSKVDKFQKDNPKATLKDACDAIGISPGDYKLLTSIRIEEEKAARDSRINALKEKGHSNQAIANKLGITEGTVRNVLKKKEDKKKEKREQLMNVLEEAVKEKKLVSVSEGAAERIGVKKQELKVAYERLAAEGKISIHNIKIKQVGTGHETTIQAIAPVDIPVEEVRKNKYNVQLIDAYVENNDRTIRNIKKPVSVSSDRIQIKYAEDGGKDMDGVIELRRNVPDISLGKASYAQVRIAVDDTHYLKGMAVYADDLPPGVDIRFNTNKHKGTPKMDVLKEMERFKYKDPETGEEKKGEIDWENPFKATIKMDETLKKCQRYYTGKDGKQHLSPINVVNEEGDWAGWSKTLSAQFLSKQPRELIHKQLEYTYADKKAQLEEIMTLTNPIVKKHLLTEFADSCDYDSVHLKAAALPRQASHVILPLPKMAENQIYAPDYKNGEKVVLIRYPHAGTFEIPELTVNNNSPTGKKMIPKNGELDAVGIHPKVASQLSGADFDGDTVMVIPVNRRVHIETSKAIEGLADFDPQEAYPGFDGMKKMTKLQRQNEMGRTTNLISDMGFNGANDDEMARAVKHSMVVIDAYKHGLNYKLSEQEFGINELREKYQGSKQGGAATLITRAKSRKDVDERRSYYNIDPTTGEKIYKYTKRKAREKLDDGTWVTTDKKKQQQSTKMAEAKDARELYSDPKNPDPKEIEYAIFANRMKAMANQARKETLNVEKWEYNKTAASTYAKEVVSLDEKLKEYNKLKPLETKAQMIANAHIKQKLDEDPSIKDDPDRLKKLKYQALNGARYRVGKTKDPAIKHLTDREWEAIQSGAIRKTAAEKILLAADSEEIRRRATPRAVGTIPTYKQAQIKAKLASGNYSMSEIADELGVSLSTVRKYAS